MRQRISLHIGLNEVDGSRYACVPPLRRAEGDAGMMMHIAEASGFSCLPPLLGANATLGAFGAGVAEAVSRMGSGGFLLISFAGHGAQLPAPAAAGVQRRHQTWCLFDGEVVDEGLLAALAGLRADARVLIVSDCCHGGVDHGDNRARGSPAPRLLGRMPSRGGTTEASARTSLVGSHPEVCSPDPSARDRGAPILRLSSCLADELSYEGDTQGQFTEAFARVWMDRGFRGSYRQLEQRINELTGTYQTANLTAVTGPGEGLRRFIDSSVFWLESRPRAGAIPARAGGPKTGPRC